MIEKKIVQGNIDVPGVLFSDIRHQTVHARIVATEKGVLAGSESLACQAEILGLEITLHLTSGEQVQPGSAIATLTGNPKQIVRGEDLLLGVIAKFSGIATASHQATEAAGNIRVVCGGWKKMPVKIKDELRNALRFGGVDIRILPVPFLYLDKNYIRIFGSIAATLENARKLSGRAVIIQVRGENSLISREAITAVEYGAQILMVDTGNINDLREVSSILKQEGLRERVKIAFAGNIHLSDLEHLQNEDVDIVDIGRAILDAPLLDFSYDVIETGENRNGI